MPCMYPELLPQPKMHHQQPHERDELSSLRELSGVTTRPAMTCTITQQLHPYPAHYLPVVPQVVGKNARVEKQKLASVPLHLNRFGCCLHIQKLLTGLLQCIIRHSFPDCICDCLKNFLASSRVSWNRICAMPATVDINAGPH